MRASGHYSSFAAPHIQLANVHLVLKAIVCKSLLEGLGVLIAVVMHLHANALDLLHPAQRGNLGVEDCIFRAFNIHLEGNSGLDRVEGVIYIGVGWGMWR